jgi:thioredoxin-like negative regulator of GroEL
MSFLRRYLIRITDHLTETQWDTLRAVVLIAVIGGVGAGGYYLGVPAWRHWQNRRALSEAEVFAQARDYRSLMLALRRATELAPGDLATWQAASRILSEIGSPETLVAREELTQLAPQDMAMRLALAQDALRFGRLDTAEEALSGLDAAARQDVAFHRLAAALAMTMGRTAEVDKELQAILAAEPNNPDARFTYAALRLWSPDPNVSAGGESDLEKLLDEPKVRVRAAIELLSSESRLGGPGEITQVLVRLLARFAPKAAPDFTAPAVPGWAALVDGIKAAAAGVPDDAALVARWLANIGRWPEALAWVDALPAPIRNAQIVADITAEIAADHDELARLARLLRENAWGPWPENAQILALATRVQILHFNEERGRQTWDDAINACGDSLAGLRSLARLAASWHYVDGQERVLRRVLARDPKTFWAYGALRQLYLQESNYPQLWTLYSGWSHQLPQDPSVVGAWMLLAAVLDHADKGMLARAVELQSHNPGSLSAQVGHAAVLWRLHRPVEAAALLDSLPAAAQQRADISFWIALVQADLGHHDAAVAAIARARTGVNANEERALLRIAENKVGYGL